MVVRWLIKWPLLLPVCLLSVALFFRKLLIKGGGGASFSANPTVASRAVVGWRPSPSSSSTCRTGVGGISVLLQSLQLGQRDNVAALGPMPHCALGGGVVVVEARGIGIKQLPPLVVTCPLDANALRGVPHALARQQVGIHTFPRAWLNYLHPLQPAGREFTIRLLENTLWMCRKYKQMMNSDNWRSTYGLLLTAFWNWPRNSKQVYIIKWKRSRIDILATKCLQGFKEKLPPLLNIVG